MEIEVYCNKHSMYQLLEVDEKIDGQGIVLLSVASCPKCWNEAFEQGYEQGRSKNGYEQGGENGP